MARINVKATVSAPEEITIPLVRADHAEAKNIFRVCFEVFLAVTSAIFGYLLSVADWTPIHWAALLIPGVSALVFLGLGILHPFKKD